MSERTLLREGCDLHYWLGGPEGAPMLVFCHGLSVDHHTWDGQVPAFADRYRILTWDARGHSASAPSGQPPVFSRMVEDLRAILDEVPEARQPIWMLGQSMGGNLIEEFCYRWRERVAGLVCLGCACNTLPLTWIERMSIGPGMAIVKALPDGYLRREIARRSAVTPAAREYIFEVARRMTKADFVTTLDNLFSCLHPEPGYTIGVPLLILRGQYDELGNFKRAMPLWNQRDKLSEYHVIADGGHCANMDQPEVFNRLVDEFLSRHSTEPKAQEG